MPQIGSTLRAARTARGLELAQIEAETKIGVRYLTALEDERFDVLPAPAYARAFLRTYARYLGLEPQRLVDALNERLPDEEPAFTLVRPRRPWRLPSAAMLVAVIGMAGLIALVVAGYFGSSHRNARPSAPPPPVVHPPKAPPRPVRRTTPAAPRKVKLVLAAARGDCWLSVRIGSEQGTVAWEGTLQHGRTLYFTSRRPLWIRIGAPQSLSLRLNGQPVGGFPAGPVNIVAHPRRVRVVSTH
jgi:cytoskeleton protein RodZ